MIFLRFLKFAALGLVLVLGGCGSDKSSSDKQLAAAAGQVFAQIKAKAGAPKGKAPVVQVTAKQIDNTKIPALQVNPETRGGSDFLKRIAQRNDATPGTVAVWRTSDNAQLIIRGGVLVGSRGIGGDIISSEATPTVRAIAGARAGQGERRYFMSDGGSSDVEVVLSCDIQNLGRSDTRIVHQSYQTIHLRENCVGGAGNRIGITNEYWVQPGSGIVRRSRQWAGPYSGYFELILLKN